ncbi:hypothetical protein AZF01_21675 (plasmid) [Martelella sp. AD-3]|nr:hypothetical protein AZF01_21675 [Martelella sp. AD-3]
MGERSLKRLMLGETGLTFGRWRRRLHRVIALRELASGRWRRGYRAISVTSPRPPPPDDRDGM